MGCVKCKVISQFCLIIELENNDEKISVDKILQRGIDLMKEKNSKKRKMSLTA